MDTRISEMSTELLGTEDLQLYQEELLDNARNLDHFGRRFERYMSMQLQKLEVAIDRFEREKEAWNRQRERELEELTSKRPIAVNQASENRQAHTKPIANVPQTNSSNSSAPLLLLIQPGEVSSMQLGLLLFEISKMNREFGGGGVRFEVSSVKLPKKVNKRTDAKPIIGIEAFSFVPLLSYDGSPAREMASWENFKSKLLMSSLLDANLLKSFKKCVSAPRDHDSVVMANESTLRAEHATTKCEATSMNRYEGFFSKKKDQHPKQQQLQRVEDIFRYLNKEYKLRMHLSLVW